ncbi:MAG: transcription elongation factor GreB [Porticoccaceae bacterium]
MSRYRAPQPKSSPYITSEGADTLRAERHQLWKIERPLVTNQVHEAAKNGDRSENGDYIYGKRRLREIDSRVRYLNKRLDEVTVVSQTPTDPSRIFFGAWVTLKNNTDETTLPEVTYRLVGADEIDPSRGHISIDSPLARALMGKSVDADIRFIAAEITQHYRVRAISYSE